LARRGAGIAAAFALAAGVVTELVVLHQYPGQLTWLPGVLIAVGLVVALGLIAVRTRPVRAALLAAALGLLLLAPASWAVQTLGHATEGTFPAGGPATVGFGGGAGGPGGGPGCAPAAGANGFAPPGATQGGPSGGFGGQPGGFGGQGGGPFGDSGSLTAALQYVQQHGGGTIAVSSQTGASTAIIQSGADV